jgi:glycerol-3-phosphate dehydrogenase
LVSKSGLITVTGGKWTTYRAMAEDVLAQAFAAKLLSAKASGATVHLPLVGAQPTATRVSAPPGLHLYGSEAAAVQALPGAQHELGGAGVSGLTEAMVRFAARCEYARTVEDVLARRARLLFLDARLAASLAAEVACILQQETGVDPQLDVFMALAEQYTTLPI